MACKLFIVKASEESLWLASLLTVVAQDRQNTSKTVKIILPRNLKTRRKLRFVYVSRWNTGKQYVIQHFVREGNRFYWMISWVPRGRNKMAPEWHERSYFLAQCIDRCIVKMGFLLHLYVNRGYILSWKFINTMRCHIFVKRAANGSSNDAHDQVIDQANALRLDCVIISTVYHWHIIMKARIVIKRN